MASFHVNTLHDKFIDREWSLELERQIADVLGQPYSVAWNASRETISGWDVVVLRRGTTLHLGTSVRLCSDDNRWYGDIATAWYYAFQLGEPCYGESGVVRAFALSKDVRLLDMESASNHERLKELDGGPPSGSLTVNFRLEVRESDGSSVLHRVSRYAEDERFAQWLSGRELLRSHAIVGYAYEKARGCSAEIFISHPDEYVAPLPLQFRFSLALNRSTSALVIIAGRLFCTLRLKSLKILFPKACFAIHHTADVSYLHEPRPGHPDDRYFFEHPKWFSENLQKCS